jgi:hypothetical protein
LSDSLTEDEAAWETAMRGIASLTSGACAQKAKWKHEGSMQSFPSTAETVGVDQDVGIALVTERYPYVRGIIANRTAALHRSRSF